MKILYTTGLFPNEESAGEAVRALVEEGFAPADISVVTADQAGAHAVELEHKTGAIVGGKAGGALGAALGAAGATLVAVGAVAAPGIGLLASGPLVAALQGAATGAAGGGLIGALAGLAFWEEDVTIPDRLKEGVILVGVPASEQRSEAAERHLRQCGAERVYRGKPATG